MKEDIYSFLENVGFYLINLLPRIAMALGVLIVGYLLGRIVRRLIRRSILYLNDRLNQTGQGGVLNVDLKNSATFISGTFFWIIMIISIVIGVQVLRIEFLGLWFEQVISYLPNIVAAVIIVFVGIISGRLLEDLINSAAARTGITNGKFLGKLTRYLILFIAIVISVDQLGVDIAFLTNLIIILLGALLFGAALTFSLGAKTSVKNILGSYYVRKSYHLGNRVRLGELEGTIVKITDHAVSIETSEGIEIVPASTFSEKQVLILNDEQVE